MYLEMFEDALEEFRKEYDYEIDSCIVNIDIYNGIFDEIKKYGKLFNIVNLKVEGIEIIAGNGKELFYFYKDTTEEISISRLKEILNDTNRPAINTFEFPPPIVDDLVYRPSSYGFRNPSSGQSIDIGHAPTSSSDGTLTIGDMNIPISNLQIRVDESIIARRGFDND